MSDYYFLASLLPELQIKHVPTLNFSGLKEYLEINLSKEDKKRVREFLRIIDLDNLHALWVGEQIDPRGNFNAEALTQALEDRRWPDGTDFPNYLNEYLDKYSTTALRAKNFFFLMSQFLEDQKKKSQGFLRAYYTFEKEFRLLLVGFRAKKLGRDIQQELQYEDATDSFVAQIIAQKDAQSYEPPFEYQELRPIFELYANQPLELQQALDEYKFEHLIEMSGNDAFSIDQILGYMARLLIVEKWLELNVQKGIEVVDTIVEGING